MGRWCSGSMPGSRPGDGSSNLPRPTIFDVLSSFRERYIPGKRILYMVISAIFDPDFDIRVRTGQETKVARTFQVWRCSCGYLLADYSEVLRHKEWGHEVSPIEMHIEIKASFNDAQHSVR